MEIRNCKECGCLFNYMGKEVLCDACKKKIEDKFDDVKKYLDEHPNATVSEVAEENEIAVKQIKQWIREERLTLTAASADGITCERCGTPIKTGRFCERCKTKMQNTFSGVLVQPKVQETVDGGSKKNKMRFL